MANRGGSAQNEGHEAYGWSRGEQAGTDGHRGSPLLLCTAGLLPAVGGDPRRVSFQPAFVGKTVGGGKMYGLQVYTLQMWEGACSHMGMCLSRVLQGSSRPPAALCSLRRCSPTCLRLASHAAISAARDGSSSALTSLSSSPVSDCSCFWRSALSDSRRLASDGCGRP